MTGSVAGRSSWKPASACLEQAQPGLSVPLLEHHGSGATTSEHPAEKAGDAPPYGFHAGASSTLAFLSPFMEVE